MSILGGLLRNPREVADILGVTEDRVRCWIKLGMLPASHNNDPEPDDRLIKPDDLLPFIEPLVEPDVFDSVYSPEVAALTKQLDALQLLGRQTHTDLARAESRGRPLFHYTSATTALDHILLEAELRLSPPSRTNDPYEFEPRWTNFLVEEGTRQPEPQELQALWARASGALRDRCRVACLTLSDADPSGGLVGFGDGYKRSRMWAQYADRHAGVCLAFDQAKLIQAARESEREGVRLYKAPVRYRSEDEGVRPIQLPLKRVREDIEALIGELFPSFVAGLYFSKAWDWNTETEYRFLVHGNVDEYEHVGIRDALTGVFCGPRFPDERLADLRFRCPDLWEAGRVYKMAWHNGLALAFPLNGPERAVIEWDLPPAPIEPIIDSRQA